MGEKVMPEYSQGICGDGAAILKDGVMLTIDEIVSELNAAAQHERIVAGLKGLLGAAVCPMAAQGCDGTQYPVGDPHGDFWGEQCQWCHEKNAFLAQTAEENERNGHGRMGRDDG